MKRFLLLSAVSVFLAAPIAGATSFEKAPMVFLGDVPAEVAPAPPGESVVAGFFKQFVTPQGIASVVVTILGLVGGALGLSALRKRQIAIATNGAFHLVEDFAATTETDIDDKIALGLQKANEWMVAQGWRPLKPGEVDSVKLGFTAINGAMKAAEKVQAAAIEAARPSTP